MARIRPAVNRWLIVTIVWQALVIGAGVLYLVVLGPTHGRSLAWIAPPMGAAFGVAGPLQFIVRGFIRAMREAH
jgi:hypothetical protein